jgi:hypothetical protein
VEQQDLSRLRIDRGERTAAVTRARPSARRWLWVALLLLTVHYALAVSSLVRENPTIDEVLHLPAGITYWQMGTFKLYRHNPPLVKLLAALPAMAQGVVTAPIYQSGPAWQAEYPSQAAFGQYFTLFNASRLFEIYRAARLTMPLWSVLGGLVVFAIMLSGFFFPVQNMPEWARALTWLNPMRFFMTIVRGVLLRGAGVAELSRELLALSAMGLAAFGTAVALFRRSST